MQSLIGHELGQYKVLEELGRGSMGVVYKGLHTTLDRDVAIKVLAPNLVGDQELVERFLREAKLAGRLNHPHVVHIYDQGQDGNVFYIVMEYVDGSTLRQLLGDRGKFGPERTLEIAVQVCEALQCAHEAGIIHRDVKPDNIMIDKHGVAKVADFGLAKGITSLTLTTPGAFVGSPYYVSLEQLRGDNLDFRTDIYSLGRVMYRMLVGRTPFESSDLLALIYMEMNNPIPPLREFGIDVSPDLEALVMKAQAKNRDERFQTASETLAALKMVKSRLEREKNSIQHPSLLAAKLTHKISLGAPSAFAQPAPSSVATSGTTGPVETVKPPLEKRERERPTIRPSLASRFFSALSYLGLLGVICLLLCKRNRLVLTHSRQAIVLHIFRLAFVSIPLYAFDMLRAEDVFMLATVGIAFPAASEPTYVLWEGWSIAGIFWLIALAGMFYALRGMRWRMPLFGPFSEIHVVEEFLGIERDDSGEMGDGEEEEKRKLIEIQKERWRRYEEAMEATQRERARQQRLQQIGSRIDEILRRAEQLNDKLALGEVERERFDELRSLYDDELAALKEEARLLGASFSSKTISWITDRKINQLGEPEELTK